MPIRSFERPSPARSRLASARNAQLQSSKRQIRLIISSRSMLQHSNAYTLAAVQWRGSICVHAYPTVHLLTQTLQFSANLHGSRTAHDPPCKASRYQEESWQPDHGSGRRRCAEWLSCQAFMMATQLNVCTDDHACLTSGDRLLQTRIKLQASRSGSQKVVTPAQQRSSMLCLCSSSWPRDAVSAERGTS